MVVKIGVGIAGAAHETALAVFIIAVRERLQGLQRGDGQDHHHCHQ